MSWGSEVAQLLGGLGAPPGPSQIGDDLGLPLWALVCSPGGYFRHTNLDGCRTALSHNDFYNMRFPRAGQGWSPMPSRGLSRPIGQGAGVARAGRACLSGARTCRRTRARIMSPTVLRGGTDAHPAGDPAIGDAGAPRSWPDARRLPHERGAAFLGLSDPPLGATGSPSTRRARWPPPGTSLPRIRLCPRASIAPPDMVHATSSMTTSSWASLVGVHGVAADLAMRRGPSARLFSPSVSRPPMA